MTNSNSDRRSASISVISNGNNNGNNIGLGHHKASASISGPIGQQPISTTGFNPSYFSPSIKPTPIQQRAGSVGAVNFSKSYGGQGQLGTSLTNIVSPASTYDGLLDSPYGSYTGNSLTDSYLKSPMNSPSFKTIGSPASFTGTGTTPGGSSHVNPKNALSKENKLSRRRELHNAVERRRRDLIKEKIKELSSLIPPPLLNDPKNNGGKNGSTAGQKEIKVNKSVTLTKGVEYIGYLKQILLEQDERLLLLQSKIDELDNLPNEPTNNNNNNNNQSHIDGQFGQQQQMQQQQVSITNPTSQSPQPPNSNSIGNNIADNVMTMNPNSNPNTNTNSNRGGLEMEISNDLYDFLNEDGGNGNGGFGGIRNGNGSGGIRNGAGNGNGGDNFLQDLISKSGGAGGNGNSNGSGSDGWMN
ncbi:unnamed protein product [Ambrosiozyma monospora]|uniref:Unnamed protein product n=1 Tax=Ambrosiozyma monospora TaxID=43982 RepID=A0A9W6YZE3_AMBMO|nr:unnamed protein product [Ambrosiozyma monospora]